MGSVLNAGVGGNTRGGCSISSRDLVIAVKVDVHDKLARFAAEVYRCTMYVMFNTKSKSSN